MENKLTVFDRRLSKGLFKDSLKELPTFLEFYNLNSDDYAGFKWKNSKLALNQSYNNIFYSKEFMLNIIQDETIFQFFF